MSIFVLWVLFALFSVLLVCFSLCYGELKKLREKYSYLPPHLKAVIQLYPKDFLIENRVLSDYVKNKIINANSKIKFYTILKNYCDSRIHIELEEINQ